ncbi:MAG: hypothetical protein N2053_08725 [Chitinispirillaceae bacterium]|nr:hypothetical protein [Chitinispirillaceae bacterium]
MTPHIKVSPQKKKKTKGANGVVNAVVVTHSDFSHLLNLQNLINYLIECLTALFAKTELSENILKNIKLCLEHAKRLKPSELQIPDEELKKMIENFLEKLNSFYGEIERLSIEEIDKNTLLYGKTTELQWHSLCLLEEIKRYIFIGNIRC